MAETILPKAYGVAEINNYIREYLAEDELLPNILVKGELTAYKTHSSGHAYFTISEKNAILSGAIFRKDASRLTFEPQIGMEVIIWGSISFYERDGKVQLYGREFFLQGAGIKEEALQQLKQKLAAEGLFDQEHKKDLPFFPYSLGVISGAGSAAWADIQKVALSRNPNLQIKLYPATVQGENAAQSIVLALYEAEKSGHDLLIVGRGGGANEDLAAFNEEAVVRTIFALNTPIIAAIGHEIDTSLADLVADKRAATPTHAATLGIPDCAELSQYLAALKLRLRRALNHNQQQKVHDLQQLHNRLQALSPKHKVNNYRQQISKLQFDLDKSFKLGKQLKYEQFNLLLARLDNLSPLKTLRRGYSLCMDQNQHIIKDASKINIGDQLNIKLEQGNITCLVEGVNNE